MPPRLGVAMIVRDEASFLPGCLESLRGLAEEICVVDTGSQDETPTIAAAYGCRIVQIAWPGDFAAARNASLDLATAEWVLVLDADERLDPADHATLRAHLDAGPAGYRLLTRNYTNDAGENGFVAVDADDANAQGFRGWTPSTKVRLFPRVPSARFEGAVHELVNDRLARAGIPLRDSPVPIHHYGARRNAQQLHEKRLRYLALGQAKLAAAPHDPKAHAELGNQYTELGDYAAAAAAYRESLRYRGNDPVVLKDLGAVLHLLGRAQDARAALTIALRHDPALADAWQNLGVVEAQAARWDEAAHCFAQALAHAGHPGDLPRSLGVARMHAGDLPGAWDAAMQAVAVLPWSAPAWALAGELARRLGHTQSEVAVAPASAEARAAWDAAYAAKDGGN